MSEAYFPFDSGAGANVTEDQWRLMARHWLSSGVLAGELNNFEVYGDSSGMQVKVKSGRFWIRGHYYDSDAEQTLAIGAADPVNPRIDRVVVRADFTGNTVALAVLQGVAAGAPAAPAVTQSSALWEISLAQVYVDAAVATIAVDKITDERTYAKGANLAADLGLLRNLLANGGLDVWQRGAGPYTVTSAYTADRWQIILAGTDTLQIDREAATKKANSLYSAQGTFVLGTGAGASRFKQRLVIADGFHHLLGKAISLRLSAHVDTASAVRAVVTTDGTGGTSSYSSYHPGNSAFQELDVDNITVPTDAAYIDIGITLQASCAVYLDNVMLVPGAVPVDYVALHPADEIERCQRYYEVHGLVSDTMAHSGYAGAGAEAVGTTFLFMTAKYSAPSITKNGAGWTVTNCGQPAIGTPHRAGYYMYASSSAGGRVDFRTNAATDSVTAESNP